MFSQLVSESQSENKPLLLRVETWSLYLFRLRPNWSSRFYSGCVGQYQGSQSCWAARNIRLSETRPSCSSCKHQPQTWREFSFRNRKALKWFLFLFLSFCKPDLSIFMVSDVKTSKSNSSLKVDPDFFCYLKFKQTFPPKIQTHF